MTIVIPPLASLGRPTGIVASVESGGASAWSPGDASVGLELWYRADLGLTQAGGLVSAWADQSGQGDAGRNQSAAGSNRPSFNASDATYGNNPTVSFDGTQRMLSGVFNAGVAVPVGVVIVGEINVDSAMLSDGVASDMVFKSGGIASFYGAAQGSQPFGVADVTSPCRIMLTDDGSIAADASKLYVNDMSTPIGTGATNWSPALGLHLGLDILAVGRLMGTIAEVIVFGGVPTASDVENLVTYLNVTRAYGIGVS